MHPFEYQRPNPVMVDQIEAVRQSCKATYNVLMGLPACRERSLAITKLEEVSMWANKGIVFNPAPAVSPESAIGGQQ